jgi:hypothetical protein
MLPLVPGHPGAAFTAPNGQVLGSSPGMDNPVPGAGFSLHQPRAVHPATSSGGVVGGGMGGGMQPQPTHNSHHAGGVAPSANAGGQATPDAQSVAAALAAAQQFFGFMQQGNGNVHAPQHPSASGFHPTQHGGAFGALPPNGVDQQGGMLLQHSSAALGGSGGNLLEGARVGGGHVVTQLHHPHATHHLGGGGGGDVTMGLVVASRGPTPGGDLSSAAYNRKDKR